jgi:predicted Zn-dependent protease
MASLLALVLLPNSGYGQSRLRHVDIENIGQRDINAGISGVNFTSIDEEISLGRQLAAQLEPQLTLVSDAAVNEYINAIGQTIVRNSDAKIPVTFKIVRAEDINAFTLPGGIVYIQTGAILAAESESELAAVIAHQIGHVAARHGTEIAARAQLLNVGTIPIINGGPAVAVGQARGLGNGTTFLRFNRQAVAEADFLGVQYLYKSGYDPNSAVTFLQKLQTAESRKAKGGVQPPVLQLNPNQSYAGAGSQNTMFNSHPPTSDRIDAIRQTIMQILPARDRNVVTTPQFDQIKIRVAELAR